jgi:hypothetical protein
LNSALQRNQRLAAKMLVLPGQRHALNDAESLLRLATRRFIKSYSIDRMARGFGKLRGA